MRPLLLIVTCAAVAPLVWTANSKSDKQAPSPPEKEGRMTVTTAKPVVEETGADSAVGGMLASEAGTLTSEEAYGELIADLHASLKRVRSMPGYTAVWEQQVQKDGELRESILCDLKIREEPFSVYLRWHDDGQEAIYVEGKNSGRLLVRPHHGLAALRGVWRLRPDSPQAMRDTRYPITEIGIANLCEQALDFHEQRDFTPLGLNCIREETRHESKPAIKYTLTFDSPQAGEYSRSLLTFDRKSGLLVAVENDSWTADGKPGELLERYVYHEVEEAADLADKDFSQNNPQYSFKD